MRSFFTEIKQLSPKAVFTSLLGHALLLGLFSFTMTARHLEPRPSMTFLGAILQKQDLLSTASGQSHHSIKLTSSFTLKAAEEETVSSSQPKPAFEKIVTGQKQKISLKSIAPEPESQTPPSKENAQETQEEESIPAYVPLKLYPK